jgi:protein tyrosine/serine phosphatase
MSNYRKTGGRVESCDTSRLTTMVALCWSLLAIPGLAESADNKDATGNKDAADNLAIKAAKTSTATKPKEDLPNFHEVHPFLYRGGEPTEKGLEELKKMGVSTLIDLRAPSERKSDEPEQAKKLGLNYINLVMDSHAPTKDQVDKMMRTIDEAKKATDAGDKDKKVFVHCAHGSDRTGCMVGIWRVSRDSWDYPTTYQEMRKYYFGPKFTRLSGAVEQYANAKEH